MEKPHLTKFCGASVINIQSSAGWQEQISSLKIDLVEDKGDRFVRPDPGTPISFEFEGFRFDGLVQRWGKSRSVNGDPTYDVTIYSPVEILEAVQLILDSYRGINLLCPNLLNVFGFLEGAGDSFGGSGKNESGIAWYKIQSAIEAIQVGDTPFGPGIEYKGHKYQIDFGSIPDVPDFYRLGTGTFTSLIQAIRTVFEDAGYDFIVCLNKAEGNGPHTIFFKSHSRLIQEPLGQIAAFVEGKDNIVSFEEGAELRNDITCGIILGGEEESCISMYDNGTGNTIWNFWGYQQTPYLIPFTTEGNQPIVESSGYGNSHTVLLNATAIGDIIGSDTGGPPIYECSAFEMRLALVDFDSWSVFIGRKRPKLAESLGLSVFPSIFNTDDYHVNPQSFYANDAASASGLSDNDKEDAPMQKLDAIYNFVKNYAETYMGKQFVVSIPFWLKYYFEEETNKILYNLTSNADGYYPDYLGGWTSGPLGLAYENFNQFSNDSGKFMPFLKFGGPDIIYANLNARNNSDMVIQNQNIFISCNQDANILFTPSPAVLCSLNEPLWSVSPDPVGGISDIAWLCDMNEGYLMRVLESNNGEFPIKIHPLPFTPQGAAVCLRSNEFVYGPWSKIGVPGKVKIEQNTGLVPWNYGGFETMRIAAEAQLADIGASNQIEESGQVTYTDTPNISLGDRLNDVGPVVTSIDASIGSQGITTTLRMRSQTAIQGTFSKQNAERLRRLGTSAQDMRRNMRALYSRIKENKNITTQSKWVFMQNVSRAIKKNESTNVLQAFTMQDPSSGAILTQVSAQSFSGAVGSSSAHNPEAYKATASMGLEGLLRPFSTDPENEFLPHYEVIDKTKPDELDPFQKGSDILWSAFGKEYHGYYTGRENDMEDTRPLGLRGPLVVVGWGKEITGKPVPNENTNVNVKIQDMTDKYLEKHLLKFNKWKAGRVDLRWDKWNKVWGFPTILLGTYQGENKVKLLGKEDIVEIAEYLGGNIRKDQRVVIGYYIIDKKWYIISASC